MRLILAALLLFSGTTYATCNAFDVGRKYDQCFANCNAAGCIPEGELESAGRQYCGLWCGSFFPTSCKLEKNLSVTMTEDEDEAHALWTPFRRFGRLVEFECEFRSHWYCKVESIRPGEETKVGHANSRVLCEAVTGAWTDANNPVP